MLVLFFTYTVYMDTKKVIWVCMIVGSFLGGFIPTLLGANSMGVLVVLTTAVGGLLGVWAGFTMTR